MPSNIGILKNKNKSFTHNLLSPGGHQGDSIQAAMAVIMVLLDWRILRH